MGVPCALSAIRWCFVSLSQPPFPLNDITAFVRPIQGLPCLLFAHGRQDPVAFCQLILVLVHIVLIVISGFAFPEGFYLGVLSVLLFREHS